MEKFVRNIENQNFEFICEYWENRNAWGHKATLLGTNKNTKIRYYNRTWEKYRFQSVMIQLVYELIASEQQRIINHWKVMNDKKRISKNQKDKLFSESKQLNIYNKLIRSL